MASEDTMAAFTATIDKITNKNTTKEGQVKIQLEECPVKRKNCSTEAWLSQVELWDSANNTGDPTKLNIKKYLAVMESIRKAEDRELERTAEVEFVENREFDKKAKTVVRAMIDKLK